MDLLGIELPVRPAPTRVPADRNFDREAQYSKGQIVQTPLRFGLAVATERGGSEDLVQFVRGQGCNYWVYKKTTKYDCSDQRMEFRATAYLMLLAVCQCFEWDLLVSSGTVQMRRIEELAKQAVAFHQTRPNPWSLFGHGKGWQHSEPSCLLGPSGRNALKLQNQYFTSNLTKADLQSIADANVADSVLTGMLSNTLVDVLPAVQSYDRRHIKPANTPPPDHPLWAAEIIVMYVTYLLREVPLDDYAAHIKADPILLAALTQDGVPEQIFNMARRPQSSSVDDLLDALYAWDQQYDYTTNGYEKGSNIVSQLFHNPLPEQGHRQQMLAIDPNEWLIPNTVASDNQLRQRLSLVSKALTAVNRLLPPNTPFKASIDQMACLYNELYDRRAYGQYTGIDSREAFIQRMNGFVTICDIPISPRVRPGLVAVSSTTIDPLGVGGLNGPRRGYMHTLQQMGWLHSDEPVLSRTEALLNRTVSLWRSQYFTGTMIAPLYLASKRLFNVPRPEEVALYVDNDRRTRNGDRGFQNKLEGERLGFHPLLYTAATNALLQRVEAFNKRVSGSASVLLGMEFQGTDISDPEYPSGTCMAASLQTTILKATSSNGRFDKVTNSYGMQGLWSTQLGVFKTQSVDRRIKVSNPPMLSIHGELTKLQNNVCGARLFRGAHFKHSLQEGARIGELLGLGFLQNIIASNFTEVGVDSIDYTTLDQTRVRIRADSVRILRDGLETTESYLQYSEDHKNEYW